MASADAAPATSCLPARRWRHPRVPRTPLDPLHLSPLSRVSPSVPIPLCSLSLPRPNGAAATDELHHGHRLPLASPTCPEAPPSIAASPQPGPKRWDGLHRRRPHLLPSQKPVAADVDSPPTGRPRAHLASRPTPRELLFSSPHSPHLISSPSSFFHHGRSSPPPCLVAVVARATMARSRAHCHAQRSSRSP